MTRSILLSLWLLTLAADFASAQITPDTLYTVRQELPLPPNDSGGRWLPSAMIFTSISAYPTHVQISAIQTGWKFADSAYYLADSITIGNFNGWTFSNQPWKYIDSSGNFKQLDFLLPAHGMLRLPIKMQAITQSGPPDDTVSYSMYPTCYSDSLGKRRYGGGPDTVLCISMYSRILGAWQHSVPKNDSGGRWLASTVDVQSVAPFATRVYIGLSYRNDNSLLSYPDTFWKVADSALYMADSIYVTNNTYYHYTSGTPLKYLDTIHSKTSDGFDAYLTVVLPAHGMLHIPFFIRAIGDPSYSNLSDRSFGVGYYDRNMSWNPYYIDVRCPFACSGPFVQYDGQTATNKDAPAVIGQAAVPIKGSCLNCTFLEGTHATYKVIGEYPNQFIFPDTVFDPSNSYPNTLQFKGAPKSPIYDTLVAAYTNCWGTITTRTPVTAYSAYPDGYKIRQLPAGIKAPFLGSAQVNAAVIINTSDFPIALRNLRASGYDSVDFDVSAPATIAAHDSANVTVTLTDRDVYLDTLYPDRYTYITGTVAPYQQELNFIDSTFTFSISDTIDVYSPQYYGFYLPPEIKHGTHPRGIIFTSSVTSTEGGPGTFMSVYGNDDNTTEYFGVPYYDDPHFKITIGNYNGLGTVTLPSDVLPDTAFPPAIIEALTTFTGDNHHIYYTQLHWPRSNDTITIDVVAVGNNAPPYQSVREGVPSAFHLWPNPASHIVHIESGTERSEVWIIDVLGRMVRKQLLISASEIIDVSDVQPGMYELYIPSAQRSTKLQILR